MATRAARCRPGRIWGAEARGHASDGTSHAHGRDDGTGRLNPDSVQGWNQHAFDTIQAGASTPPCASRALAMESLAVFRRLPGGARRSR
jgi:hypothetical protein